MSAQPGTLHVVATPIGNLADLTPRAQEVLRAHARQAEQRTPSFCTDCGEENPATFETCWSCGACIWTA